MERIVSRYKNNVLASKKKRIYSRLLDYFSIFVVTYLLFTVFNAIASYMPIYENIAISLSNINYQTAEYIDSTHLQRLNEGKTALKSIDDGANEYAERVAKTSAYVYGLAFPVKQDDGTFIDQKVEVKDTFIYELEKYELDNLSYYYKKFKKEDASLNNYVYEEVDYKNDIETYQYLKVMKCNETNYASLDNEDYISRGEGVSRYVVLTKANTEKLLKYYRDDKVDVSMHETVFETYIKGAQFGIKDVENNSASYKDLMDEFDLYYQKLCLAVFLVYLFSYLIAFMLLIVILRLARKEWTTLGLAVMSLAFCDYDEMTPSIWRLILYYFTTFILAFSSSIICFYFIGMFGVMSLKIIGSFTLLALLIALLVFNVLSLFMPFFNKNNHDFASFIAHINVKDTKDFDGPVLDVIEENDSGDGNTESRSDE